MRRIRFLVVLVGALGLLALVGDLVLMRTTSAWFERDLSLRAHLAVASANKSLATAWNDQAELGEVLVDIARDERIIGVAACGDDGTPAALTSAWPPELTCLSSRELLRRHGERSGEGWMLTTELAGGPVHLSALPVEGGGG